MSYAYYGVVIMKLTDPNCPTDLRLIGLKNMLIDMIQIINILEGEL